MIDGKIFFDQPIKNDKITYDNIGKIAIGQGDDYKTGCLLDYGQGGDYKAGCFLDYAYFKKYYKMIAIDLSKEQALDTDPRAIQQINFPANLDIVGNTRIYFILDEAKETVFDFPQGTVKVL